MNTGFLRIFPDAGWKSILDTPLARPIKRMANSYTVPSIEGLKKIQENKVSNCRKTRLGLQFSYKTA